jgi:lactoylglutathione lyase
MPRLDHVAVRVSDLDAATSFYQDRLGLKLLFSKVDEAHHEAFCFFELDGANLELLQSLDDQNCPKHFSPQPVCEPFCPHFAIATDNLDSFLTKLKNDGVPIVKGPMEIADKVKWAYIQDPDNNIIEFVQWL